MLSFIDCSLKIGLFFTIGKDIATQFLHIAPILLEYMNRLTLAFKTLPNEARVFTVAFSLFIIAVTLFAFLLYLGV